MPGAGRCKDPLAVYRPQLENMFWQMTGALLSPRKVGDEGRCAVGAPVEVNVQQTGAHVVRLCQSAIGDCSER